MENTGSSVIEDWRIIIRFIEGVSKLDNGYPPLYPKLSLTTYIDDKNKTITYRPKDNMPLIQKDNKYFEISLLPEPNSNKILLEWELLVRDFNRKEIVKIGIEPEFIEKINFEAVNNKVDLTKDKIFISYYVVDKETKNNA
jgi:hypothetical protein